MKSFAVATFLLLLCGLAPARAAESSSDAALVAALRADAQRYLSTRKSIEHISAVSISVNLKGVPANINATAGTTSYGGTVAVTPDNLFQIGSNTKSFTAVALLQLEAEGKLNIEQTLGKWLPQYPAWKAVTIHRLLDMTSGIPTYDDEDSVMGAYARNPLRNWSANELIAAVYPKLKPKAGWIYSNTNYLLGQLIIEKVTGHTYAQEIRSRFLSKPSLGLNSTYYEENLYPASVSDRLVSGYFFSNDLGNAPLKPLYGKDVRLDSVSWAQGAGAILATPEDLTRWKRALYEGPLLAPKQRRELMTIVSLATAKPIPTTTLKDPRGFGLGVAQSTMAGFGTFWFYEGETLGYRVLATWFPKPDTVVVIGVNSQPNAKDDALGSVLMKSVHDTLHSFGKL